MVRIGVPGQNVNALAYTDARLSTVPMISSPRRPLTSDKKFPMWCEWRVNKNAALPAVEGEFYKLIKFESNGDATWLEISKGFVDPIEVDQGGTGQTSYTDGQLLIGNTTGNTLAKATLTGTADEIVVTNGSGSVTLGVSPTYDGGTGIVTVGALDAGSITSNFGSVDVGTSTITCGQLNADNLRTDGNTFSSVNTNGDINITPNGSGDTVITSPSFLFTPTTLVPTITYNTVSSTNSVIGNESTYMIMGNLVFINITISFEQAVADNGNWLLILPNELPLSSNLFKMVAHHARFNPSTTGDDSLTAQIATNTRHIQLIKFGAGNGFSLISDADITDTTLASIRITGFYFS